MFDYLRAKRELQSLNKSVTRTSAAYKKELEAARKEKKSRDEIYGIQQSEYQECRIYLDEIDQINTRLLCAQANRLGVPVPTDEGSWDESNIIGGRALTTKAFAELRTAMRKEQNERWAYWELRLKVLAAVFTAVTGAAGALIGLIAIWKK